MIKTVMMICMMMAFAASAQAESVLLTLPFGVVLGKPISKKSLRYATPHYDAFYEFQRGWYADKGKGGILNKMYTYNDEDKEAPALPKKWRNIGLKLCDKGGNGSSRNQIKTIMRREGGVSVWGKKDDRVYYDLADRYRFIFEFKDGSSCLTGIHVDLKVTSTEF